MQIHHYAMEVRNLEKSKQFYKEILHFQEETSIQFLGENIIFLTLGGIRLELIESRDLQYQHDRMHLCFQVKNLKDTINDLAIKQMRIIEGPYHLENGWKIVFFEGPDGEVLEFLESEK